MSSQIIVVLAIVILALAGVGYLEVNSRRNKPRPEEEDANDEVMSNEQ